MGLILSKYDIVALSVSVLAPEDKKLQFELPKTAFGWLELTLAFKGVSPDETISLRTGQQYTKRDCYLHAVELDPECFIAWNNLGATFSTPGEIFTASNGKEYTQRACFQRAVELDPKSATAWSNLGCVSPLPDTLQDAVCGHAVQPYDPRNCYQSALELDPVHSRAWYNLGLLLHRNHSSLESVAVNDELCTKKVCFRRAVVLDPHYSFAWNNLGVVLSDQGNDASVFISGRQFVRKACYQRAVESDPTDFAAWSNWRVWIRDDEIVSVNGHCFTKRTSALRMLALDPKDTLDRYPWD